MNPKNGIVFAFLLILVVGIMGCATNQNSGNPDTNPETNPGSGNDGNPAGTNGGTENNGSDGTTSPPTKEFSIVAKQFEFTPSTITVKKGDNVIIHLTSADVKHGFSLQEFNISKEVDAQTPVTIEFVADKTGTFEFRCSVPCGEGHLEMTGQLIVQE